MKPTRQVDFQPRRTREESRGARAVRCPLHPGFRTLVVEGIPDELRSALENIDIAFVCMNLPYTMTPGEAARCVSEFRPKVVYPYHYRGSDLDVFKYELRDFPDIEVRIENWYQSRNSPRPDSLR